MTDQGPEPIREDPPDPLPGNISPRRRKLESREKRREASDDDPRDRVHTPYDEDGPEETDPERRESMTIGEIEPSDGEVFPDTAGRGPPKNLTDICATYPLGDGAHYIRVERLKPTVFYNLACSGVLGEIHEAMTESDFRRRYGGGTYELIVYGPDPRGRTNPQTDEPIIKALTKPVKLTVPGKPNPATITGGRGDSRSDDVEPGLFDRRRFGGGGGLPPTSAEASIHRDGISFAQGLVNEERRKNEALEKEQRDRAEREAQQVVAAVRESTSALQKRLELEIETERQARLAAERKLDEQAKRPNDTQTAWGAMKDVAQALAPRGSSENELQRIYDSHRNEINRLTDQHRVALDEIRRAADERVKGFQDQLEVERRRAQEHERDLRDSLERKEKDVREEHEKRLREANERHDREMRDADQRRRDEIDRLRADHDRELKAAERQADLLRQTDKTSLESRLATMKDRMDLLKDELDRARTEAAEKPNLTEQLQEAETQAKLLGYEKKDESGPRDWKERVAESVGAFLQNAPEVIKAYGDNQAKKAQAQAQAQAQADRQREQQDRKLPPRQGPPPQGQEPQRRVIGGAGGPIPAQRPQQRWATEEMGPTGYPQAPEGAQSVQAGAARGTVEPAQGQRPPAAPPQDAAPPPQQPPAPQPPPEQHAPEEAPPEPSEQARAAAAEQLELLKLRVELEIARGADPTDFAKRLVDEVGPNAAFQMTERVKVDEILQALAGDPKSALSPILRRDGQTFFKKAWVEANKYSRALLEAAPPEGGG